MGPRLLQSSPATVVVSMQADSRKNDGIGLRHVMQVIVANAHLRTCNREVSCARHGRQIVAYAHLRARSMEYVHMIHSPSNSIISA